MATAGRKSVAGQNVAAMRNHDATPTVTAVVACLVASLLLLRGSPSSSSSVSPFVASGFVAPTSSFAQRKGIDDSCLSSARQQQQQLRQQTPQRRHDGPHMASSRIRQTTDTAAVASSSSSSSSEEMQQKQTVPPNIGIVEVFEDDDGDGDDDDGGAYDLTDPAQAAARQRAWVERIRDLARTSYSDESAVGRAEAVVMGKMAEAYRRTGDDTFRPTVEEYNLLLEAHAYSRSERGAIEAEALLARMEGRPADGGTPPREEDEAAAAAGAAAPTPPPPDALSYLNVMQAWAMRKEPEKVQAVLDRQAKRYAETGDEAVRPTVEGENKLIKAYGMAGDVETAEAIFRSMLVEKGENVGPEDGGTYRFKADHKSWVQIMNCYVAMAGKAPGPDHHRRGIEKVQSLFAEMTRAYKMGEKDYEPRTEAFNALIKAVGSKDGKVGAQEAEAILFEMIDRFRNNGEEKVKPNAATFRSVMAAYREREECHGFSVGSKVEQLLQIQEGFFLTDADCDKVFDERIYYSAISIIGRSKDKKRVVRIKRIVDKFKQNIANGGKARLSATLYILQLRACAYSTGTTQQNLEAFQIAVSALKELQQLPGTDVGPNSMGMFLKACHRLMPPSDKRDEVAKRVFKECCKKGIVNNFVLSEFGHAASEGLQLEVLGSIVEDGARIPRDWTRNV